MAMLLPVAPDQTSSQAQSTRNHKHHLLLQPLPLQLEVLLVLLQGPLALPVPSDQQQAPPNSH